MFSKTSIALLATLLLVCNAFAEPKCTCKKVHHFFGHGMRMECSCESDESVSKNHVTAMAEEAGIDTDSNVQDSDSGRLNDGTGPSAEMEMVISMRNRNIKTISDDSFEVPRVLGYITELDLHGNYITKVNSAAFNNLVRLQKLDLSNNDIASIEDFSFRQLGGLKSLNMQLNYLKSINMQMFEGLNELKNLDLRANEIENLGFLPFIELSELTFLDLAENFIETIDKFHFMSTPKLKVLSLSMNEVSEIGDDTFASLTNLQILDLSENQLTVLEENTFNGLYNLEMINLSGNRLNTVRGEPFKQMTKLKELNLARNQFTSIIPRVFQALPSIHEIDLSHNRFDETTYIPIALGQEQQTELIQVIKFLCWELHHKSPALYLVNLQSNNLKYLLDRLPYEDIGFNYKETKSYCSF